VVTAAVMIGRFSRSTGGCTAGPTRDVQSTFAHQSLSRSIGNPCAVIYASVGVVVFHRGVLSRAICFHFDPPAVFRVAFAVFSTVTSFVDPRAALVTVIFRVRAYDVVTGVVIADFHAAYVLVY
jgi:hypothetical protein